jgi:hypothetical protein
MPMPRPTHLLVPLALLVFAGCAATGPRTGGDNTPGGYADAPPAPVWAANELESVDVTWKGFVRDREGHPIAGAAVRIADVLTHERWDRKAEDPAEIAHPRPPFLQSEPGPGTTTPADGSFALHLKATISFRHQAACVIEAAKQGLRTNLSETLIAGYHSESRPTVIVLVQGSGTITGMIKPGKVSTLPPSTRVGLYGGDGISFKTGHWPPDGESVGQRFTLVTPDASGAFKFTGLPTGDYQVVALDMEGPGADRIRMGWGSGHGYGELAWAGAKWIAITKLETPGMSKSVEIEFPRRREVRFRVGGAEQPEISAMRYIRGHGSSMGDGTGALKRTHEGVYSVEDVMDHYNEIDLNAKGYPTLTVKLTPETDDLGLLDLGKPHGGSIECRVTFHDGRPVAGVTVALAPMREFAGEWDVQYGAVPESATANQNGTALFRHLAPGRYQPAVSQAALGSLDGRWSVIEVGDDDRVVAADLKLPEGRRVSGKLLTNVPRKAAATAYLFLVPEHGFRLDDSIHGGAIAVNTGGHHPLRPATTQLLKLTVPQDATEVRFDYPLVPLGRYCMYTVLWQDRHDLVSSVQFVEVTDQDLSLTLNAPSLTEITGSVLAANGSPLAGAEVAVALPGGDDNDFAATIHTAIVDEKGNYTLKYVPEGSWELAINWRHSGSEKYAAMRPTEIDNSSDRAKVTVPGDGKVTKNLRLK